MFDVMSIAANAQNITLDEAYANWKVGASSNLRNESIRYCLASWVKRLDENKVSMEIIAYGQISSFKLRLTPLNVERR